MAVISELIDAGLRLKQQGNHQAAIEHFRQLQAAYPAHARILFELADSWQAFGVPEQALPLYRRLVALPESQGLPPRDLPRLYTQMGAALRLVGESAESLAVIDEGLRRYPSYRPLRVYRMFALRDAGLHQQAMVESLELLVESLAPSKWDAFEESIAQVVKELRGRLEDGAGDEHKTEARPQTEASEEADAPVADDKGEALELEVKVRQPPPKSQKRGRQRQFGRKPVQIDISAAAEERDETSTAADDDAPPAGGKVRIPIDLD